MHEVLLVSILDFHRHLVNQWVLLLPVLHSVRLIITSLQYTRAEKNATHIVLQK